MDICSTIIIVKETLGVGVLGDVIPTVLFVIYYLRLKPDQEQS